MICLGIESTAHTFGVGIVTDKGKILADEKSMYKPPLGKGIHPRKAGEHHNEVAKDIIKKSLEKSKIKISDIDLFSFSQGPGLPNCLQIGSAISRYLSVKYKKPLIGVNHCVAHIEIAKLLTKSKDPVIVYCSGGNTQIIAFTQGKYRIFGETEDIPVGNAFDVLARHLKLEMPGGPEIEKLAKKGKWVNLPYVVKGMDFSFSGILTECKKLFNKKIKRENICYSFQETCFSMLVESAERALAHTNKNEIVLTGGVAANKRFQKMLNIMCEECGGNFYVVPWKYAGDCGAMIAWTGILAYKPKNGKIENSGFRKNWRTNEVEITWLK